MSAPHQQRSLTTLDPRRIPPDAHHDDEDWLMSPDDDTAPGVIAFRLTSLERQLKEFREEMRGGFAALSFVTKDTYAADRAADQRVMGATIKTIEDSIRDARQIAEDARRVAWANAGLLLAAVTVLLAVIKAVAG